MSPSFEAKVFSKRVFDKSFLQNGEGTPLHLCRLAPSRQNKMIRRNSTRAPMDDYFN